MSNSESTSDFATTSDEEASTSDTNGRDIRTIVAGVEGLVAIPSNPCGTPLPIGPIVDTYTYSQIIGLAEIDEQIGVSRNAVMPTSVAAALVSVVAEANAEATIGDLLGGITPFSAGAEGRLLARTISVAAEDISRLLAERHIEIDGRAVRLSLNPRAVQRLISGQPAVVADLDASDSLSPALMQQSPVADQEANALTEGSTELGAGDGEKGESGGASPLLRLVPHEAAKSPVADRFAVTDLAAFLAAPALPAVGGGQIQLQLDTDTVGTLLNGDTAHITLPGEHSVELVVNETAPTVTQAQQVLDTVIALGERAETGEPQRSRAVAAFAGNASAQLVLWLPWTQQWILTGYARGELLTTIALAPQEETTIEIFSWDRRTVSVERSSSVDTEDNVELSDTTHVSADVMKEVSNRNEFTRGAGMNVGVKLFDVINVGGNVTANWQNSAAEVTRSTTNLVHDASIKAAATVKQSRQVKISETSEFGREDRVTRTLRNPNMCRSLNLDYFEVLAAWKVETKLDRQQARLCVLVDNPVTFSFDRAAVRLYEQTLRRTLLDRSLVDGFAAARLLDAYERSCAFANRRCVSPASAGTGPSGGLPPWQDLLSVLRLIVGVLSGYDGLDIISAVDALVSQNTLFLSYEQYSREWAYWVAMTAAAPALAYALNDLVLLNLQTAELLAARIEAALTVSGGLGAIQPEKLKAERRDYVLNQFDGIFLNHTGRGSNTISPPGDPWPYYTYYKYIKDFGILDVFYDRGLVTALSEFVSFRQDAATAATPAGVAAAQATARDDQATDAVRSIFDLRSLADAAEREAVLLDHLSTYADYYRYELYNMLAGTGSVPTVDRLFTPGLIEPRAIGYTGHKLACPLRARIAARVLSTLIIDNDLLQGMDRSEEALLPTPAVTCETRLGQCDACEPFIDASRDVDLRTRNAQAALTEAHAARERAEADRYIARLQHTPPLLTDPRCCNTRALRVVLERSKEENDEGDTGDTQNVNG